MNSPATGLRLLVVDDEPDLRTLYELTLVREGYHVETAAGVEEAWQHLLERSYQVIITDMRLPDGSGLDLLRRLEAADRDEKAIVITAYGSADNAVAALKAGAYDYLTKPVDLRQFRAVVAAAVGRSQTARVDDKTAAKTPQRAATARPAAESAGTSRAMKRMVGVSPTMQYVRSLIDKVARSMAPVWIHGESGTGKELVARAIHEVSPRHASPFIAVNCGAIPEQLLEAEFFGYRKGAFTGANEDRDGFFQAASSGTLFLDEIGDLPLSMQSKLLRSIQERAVRAVGATAELPVDVRIISATHKDLGAEVDAGRFRQDLYYRLNVIQIRVPPLRERLEDLPLICEQILSRIAKEAAHPEVHHLSETALSGLRRHAFPGNVRELENLLHRAVALSTDSLILPEDLGLASEATLLDEPARAAPPEPKRRASDLDADGLPADLAAYLDALEKDVLLRALEQYKNNRTAAGSRLGLTLRQMRYRMARLGIVLSGPAEEAEDCDTGAGN